MKNYFFNPILIITICFFLNCEDETNKLLLIKAGIFNRGRNITNRPDESPAHKIEVSEFYYNETLITQKEFKKFALETNHITTSEKDGYCLISKEGMKDWDWEEKKGANYLYPFGKESSIKIDENFPVVCVSYLDAKKYCEHYKMRLPTEAEWEFASRAGSLARFPWGDSVISSTGKYLLNFWQGDSHENSNSKDGHIYLSPVRAFPPNKWGIYDSVGNVWQITNDYYSVTTYLEAYKYEKKIGIPLKNPKGPMNGKQIVTRGGSWWCSERTCNGYGLFYRGKVFTYSSFNNNGFRCAKDSKLD